jgi:hypothetical protein
MLKGMLTRWIDGFERQWGYDAGYMRDVIRISPASLVKFALGTRAANPKAAPPEALFAATLVGVLAEDCGPCTQLGVDMAVAGGLDPKVVRAVLAGDEAAMGETALLAFRFAHASLARDMATADPLRDEIVRRWGEKALVAISLSLVASRMYPTLKYALGHGKTCSRVVVDGVAAPVAHVALAA